jgi:hypothetical protein
MQLIKLAAAAAFLFIVVGCESITSPDSIAVYSDTARVAVVASEQPTDPNISTEERDWLDENGYTRFVGVRKDTLSSTDMLWVGMALYVKEND